MGILSRRASDNKQVNQETVTPVLRLSVPEVDCLLRTLVVSQMAVKDIEVLYSAILKIQEYRKLLSNES